MKKLDGKIAVVTGASKGIGASIAKHLAAEGAAVVVNYTSSKEGADSEAQQRFADRTQQTSPVLIATAYTDLTLPTLRQGDRGRNVELLQRILQDNGSLGAAGVRLGNPNGALVNGIFGEITTSAIRDLQQRYEIPVTGQVNPTTWEVLDMHENPYRSPLPWKQ